MVEDKYPGKYTRLCTLIKNNLNSYVECRAKFKQIAALDPSTVTFGQICKPLNKFTSLLEATEKSMLLLEDSLKKEGNELLYKTFASVYDQFKADALEKLDAFK